MNRSRYKHPLDAAEALIETPIGELEARYGSLDAAMERLTRLLELAKTIEDARAQFHELMREDGPEPPRLRLVRSPPGAP